MFKIKSVHVIALHRRSVLFFLFLFTLTRAHSQCGSFITSYPYSEGFESHPAWTSGGTNSDWAWGTPAHPTISTAGGGTKAWCVGGLTGSFYNYSQLSYLQSPCFDFTSLDAPWISFKIFWENEWKWDGLVLQYSLNSGATWTNVGAYNDPEDCFNENWYNYNSISWLTSASPKHGWTGRIGATSGSCQGGNGSGTWLTAKHCLNALANKPNVMFRFLFGSGSTCNSYDGIAIDDILIQNAPSSIAEFTYNCSGTNVDFVNTSTLCPTGYQWDFGDPASGSANTSTLANPSHAFSGPGTYTVKLVAENSCGATDEYTLPVTVYEIDVNATDPTCFGLSNGSATAAISGLSGVTYTWNTSPVQTGPSAVNLAAGTYTVDGSDGVSCILSSSFTLVSPTAIALSTSSDSTCFSSCQGTVSATAMGGTPPYSYSWSSLGTGSSFVNSVCEGTYTLTLTDHNGCIQTATINVGAFPLPNLTCNNLMLCTGSAGYLNASGADFYAWSPATGLNTTSGPTVVASPATSTTYVLTGTTNNGCVAAMDVLVDVDPTNAPVANFSYAPHQADVYHPTVEFTNLTTGASLYQWNFSTLGQTDETNPGFTFPDEQGGMYEVCLIASNSLGCSDTLCQNIIVTGDPVVYVPNAFTPNGDGVNDILIPVTNDISSNNYSFTVFNRWGQVVFESKQPGQGWDGLMQGLKCKEDVYSFVLLFETNGNNIGQRKTGHFSLLK
jgi:gliding motility-associated-like protein